MPAGWAIHEVPEEGKDGGTINKKDSEGSVGAQRAAEPYSVSGTRIYSNHTLSAGLAALNREPRKGISSHQGVDTSLLGRLCWAVIYPPEQFGTRRWRRQVEMPGTFSFLGTLATRFLLLPRLVRQAAWLVGRRQ